MIRLRAQIGTIWAGSHLSEHCYQYTELGVLSTQFCLQGLELGLKNCYLGFQIAMTTDETLEECRLLLLQLSLLLSHVLLLTQSFFKLLDATLNMILD
ncbi:hypothetical protein BGZ82_000983, partial [Podila clonocystis]